MEKLTLEILNNLEIVCMGEDCFGNCKWSAVPNGSLCPLNLDGKYLFNSSAAAQRALFNAKERYK